MVRAVAGGDVEIIGSSREYGEERIYILETIRRLDKKLDEQLDNAGAAKLSSAKMRTDLNEAHSRIKTLLTVKDQIERRVTKVETKAAYIAVGAGSIVAIVVEGAKFLLTHR